MLAATHAGQGLDRGAGFSGDLANLPILGFEKSLGKQVSVNIGELRARYFTVGGARPVLVEDIEENELLHAANGGTSGHMSILGMLIHMPRRSLIGGWRRAAQECGKRTDSGWFSAPEFGAGSWRRVSRRRGGSLPPRGAAIARPARFGRCDARNLRARLAARN